MSIHRLIETHTDGTQLQIGGGMSEMRIGAVNGPLSFIDVTPAPVEQMQDPMFDSEFVRLQVADRVVWLEPGDVRELVELLKMAHDASLDNYRRAELDM